MNRTVMRRKCNLVSVVLWLLGGMMEDYDERAVFDNLHHGSHAMACRCPSLSRLAKQAREE